MFLFNTFQKRISNMVSETLSEMYSGDFEIPHVVVARKVSDVIKVKVHRINACYCFVILCPNASKVMLGTLKETIKQEKSSIDQVMYEHLESCFLLNCK